MRLSGMKYAVKHLGVPPNKYFNILLNETEKKMKRTRLFSQPQYVQIETTTKCNLACVMCDRTYWPKKYLNNDMSFSDIKNLMEQLPNTFAVNLTGTGETMMNSEIFKILEYLKQKRYYVSFTDNFTLLNERMAQKILDVGLDEIIISVDGGTKDVYEKIRVNGKFETFCANVIRFMQLAKDTNSKIKIRSNTVITQGNEHDVPNIVSLLNEFGIQHKGFRVIGYSEYLAPHTGNLDPKNLQGIDVEYTKPVDFGIMGCSAPWINAMITNNRLVMPCCVLSQHGDREEDSPRSYGSLKEMSFEEIWNGKKYQMIRKMFAKGLRPEICQTCPIYNPEKKPQSAIPIIQ